MAMLALMLSAEDPDVSIVALLRLEDKPGTSLIPSRLRWNVPVNPRGITLMLKTVVAAETV